MSSKPQLQALKKIRPILLSNDHALPSLIHNTVQPTQRPTTSSFSGLVRTVKKQSISSLPATATPLERQKKYLDLAGKLLTPEVRRHVHLDVLDEICTATSEGGVGLGKRDRVVNLSRSMYVPSELVAQKVRNRFWFRI